MKRMKATFEHTIKQQNERNCLMNACVCLRERYEGVEGLKENENEIHLIRMKQEGYLTAQNKAGKFQIATNLPFVQSIFSDIFPHF